MKKPLTPLLLAALLAGCASTPPQIIDMRGVDPAQMAKDQYECARYANQVDAGGSTLQGAALGAGLGALIGAVVGGRDGALFGAKVFGVTGAAQGAAGAARDKDAISDRCMQGRGYSVLL